MKKITIQNMAAELGMSRNTVAKALSGGKVTPETRMQVIEKAYQMGYQKLDDDLIKELERRTRAMNRGIILVLFNRSDSLFWNHILTGISDEVNEHGYRMQLHIVDDNDVNGDETMKLLEPDVKGIIFLCGFSDSFVHGLNRSPVPKTFFNAPVEATEYLAYGNVVSLEGRFAIRTLVQRAIEKGSRTFAFIGHAPGSFNIQTRLDGMLMALKENNIEPDPAMLYTDYIKECYYNYSVVEKLVLNMPYIPDAFVCANDDVAKYVATALSKINLVLPIKTTIIGFDNTLEDSFFKQDIMTVDIRKEEVGRRLVRTTIDQINNPKLDNAMITVATYPVTDRAEKGGASGWNR